LARIDRRRKKKGSNDDWAHPQDPDARITKMKDGRTHLAHKAEHAVDLDSGAVVAVTIQPADRGDTDSGVDTVLTALDELDEVQPEGADDRAIVADKGYHSTERVSDWEGIGLRTYLSEPNRGRRRWHGQTALRDAVYRNRRRIRGTRGQQLLRRRGEYLERPHAHLYETGALRRTHLRGHRNILKRVLVHTAGFNLGLIMRQLIGVGTPRGLQGRVVAILATLVALVAAARRRVVLITASHPVGAASRGRFMSPTTLVVNSSAIATCTPGC
jgi:transposase